MTEQDPNQKTEEEFAAFAKDLAKLVGKFMLDMARLTGRGLVLAYRAIARRRMNEISSGEGTAQVASETRDNLLNRVRGRATNNDAGESAQGEVADTYVDMDAAEDPEAAAMLEDFLRESAAQGPTNAEPAGEIEIEQEMPSNTGENVETEAEKAARIEAQLHQRQAEIEADPEKQAEIAAQVDEDEQRQAEIRAAMAADLARIRAEREKKRAAFEAAEAERRTRHEAERAAKGEARLVDHEPTTEDDEVAATGDEQDHMNTSGDK